MNKITKLAVVLGIISAIAGGILAGVYQFTAPVIEARNQVELKAGLSQVFPGNYKFSELKAKLESPDPAVTFGKAYEVKNENGQLVGLILDVTTPGDQAPIEMLVGVNRNGTINGVKILKSLETPGLGANANNPSYYVNKTKKITFLDQFKGKKITDPFIPKKDVIALTGATITSTAVSKGVKAAGVAAYKYMQKVGGSE
jgi:electron transport complex protein RnfG